MNERMEVIVHTWHRGYGQWFWIVLGEKIASADCSDDAGKRATLNQTAHAEVMCAHSYSLYPCGVNCIDSRLWNRETRIEMKLFIFSSEIHQPSTDCLTYSASKWRRRSLNLVTHSVFLFIERMGKMSWEIEKALHDDYWIKFRRQ